MTVSLIVAVSDNGVIGRDGGLPWHLPRDLKHFKATTTGHHLIIGRRTWDEVGKPLPGRTMVVVTRSLRFEAAGATVVHSLEEALEVSKIDEEPFIGGGAFIYRMALARDLVDRLYLTRVHADVEGDTFLPEIGFDDWDLVSEEYHEADEKNEHACTFQVYERNR
ncbi:MAG: dihydrofolate reductase [Thermoanaerobaculales bacterium]|nr:dihydrofolate reductase [Thermoanaerobaculales bacterium]